MRCCRWPLAWLALGLLSLPAVAAPAPKKPKGHATPQACFAAIRKAAEKKDWKAITARLTPASREAAAGSAVLAAALLDNALRHDAEVMKELSATLARHGVSRDVLALALRDAGFQYRNAGGIPNARNRRWGALVKDKPGFTGAVLKMIASFYVGRTYLGEGSLKSLKVAKGRASATITYRRTVLQTPPDTPVFFIKGKDGWKMGFVEAEKAE